MRLTWLTKSATRSFMPVIMASLVFLQPNYAYRISQVKGNIHATRMRTYALRLILGRFAREVESSR